MRRLLLQISHRHPASHGGAQQHHRESLSIIAIQEPGLVRVVVPDEHVHEEVEDRPHCAQNDVRAVHAEFDTLQQPLAVDVGQGAEARLGHETRVQPERAGCLEPGLAERSLEAVVSPMRAGARAYLDQKDHPPDLVASQAKGRCRDEGSGDGDPAFGEMDGAGVDHQQVDKHLHHNTTGSAFIRRIHAIHPIVSPLLLPKDPYQVVAQHLQQSGPHESEPDVRLFPNVAPERLEAPNLRDRRVLLDKGDAPAGRPTVLGVDIRLGRYAAERRILGAGGGALADLALQQERRSGEAEHLGHDQARRRRKVELPSLAGVPEVDDSAGLEQHQSECRQTRNQADDTGSDRRLSAADKRPG
ncbi:hypothetical protein CSUB01_10645 [Colletotrichum sublineola]|uniref:Uncharacterized protein n=1 Tax=Colletotrichum sublineola TaxID=1173701 RepID=A0A066XEY3_COLSU|nr:hypothetical protein CSUB01_10645 [Colletotrichum sublineola]